MSYWEENLNRVRPGNIFTTEDGRVVMLIGPKNDGTWEADQWDGRVWSMEDPETRSPYEINISDLRHKMPPTYRPSSTTTDAQPCVHARLYYTNLLLDGLPEMNAGAPNE